MKAVWGKMDPHKRVNTFEVSSFDHISVIGVWIGLYDRRWFQSFSNWSEHEPLSRVIKPIASETYSKHAWKHF